MEWHHPQSPRQKKFRKFPSVDKVVITVFWDCEGVILVASMSRWETVNSDAYIRTVTELWKRFKRVRLHKNPTEILLQHDNTRPHKSEDSGNHHNIWLDSVTPSTLQP
jgi:hypothetical protein